MMRSLRSGSLVLLDQAIVSGASFATTIVVARMSGPAELAIYALAVTLLFLIGSVHEALIAQPYTVYVHRLLPAGRATYQGSTFVSMVGLAATASLGLSAAGLLLPDGVGPARLPSMLIALAVVAPCWLLREFARRVAFADLDTLTGLLVDASVAFAQLGALAWLAATGRLSGLTALFAIAAASAAGGIGWVTASRRHLRLRPSHFGRHWCRNWRLGRWILASRLMAQLNSEATMTWFLLFLVGPAAAGVFAACLTVVFLSNPMVLAAGLFLTPRIARVATEKGMPAASTLVWQATGGMGILLAMFVVALALLGDPVMQLMYGSQFAGHHAGLVVLAIAIAISAVGLGTASGLLAIERVDLSVLASVFGFVVLVVAALPLIGRWGVLGAGLALIAGNLVATGTRLHVFWRQTRASRGAHPTRPLGSTCQEELS